MNSVNVSSVSRVDHTFVRYREVATKAGHQSTRMLPGICSELTFRASI